MIYIYFYSFQSADFAMRIMEFSYFLSIKLLDLTFYVSLSATY